VPKFGVVIKLLLDEKNAFFRSIYSMPCNRKSVFLEILTDEIQQKYVNMRASSYLANAAKPVEFGYTIWYIRSMFDLDKLGPDICLSGGADGADLEWGMVADNVKMSVVHWSFDGHKTKAPSQTVAILTEQQLKDADPYLLQASKIIKRKFPTRNLWTKNLLRRNYYQVAWADSVYAVSTIKNGLVQGGTGWAVALFLNRFNMAACPCYVFCQDTGYWYEWVGSWKQIHSPPRPSGIFAGIGSRDLGITGRLAIRAALHYKKIGEYQSVFLIPPDRLPPKIVKAKW
jgi:hypothetical protein